MAYKTVWLVKDRVLLSTFSGIITQPELESFIAEVRSEIAKGRPLVHHISDSLGLEKLELSIKTFRSLLSAYKMIGELGWQVDVNKNSLNKMLSGLGAQFVRIRARTFASMEEAVNFLKEIDPTLANEVWESSTDRADTVSV